MAQGQTQSLASFSLAAMSFPPKPINDAGQTVEGGHRFVTDPFGEVDDWQYETDYHGGPRCLACRGAWCDACTPCLYREKCPAASAPGRPTKEAGMTVVDRVSEPCGVELYLIGWYRQELRDVTIGNGGRPASRIQRRIAWRDVQHRVAAWVMYDLAGGITPDPGDVCVWQKINAHLSRSFAADQDRR